MTHTSRDTSTGLKFESQVNMIRSDGINLSKTKLKKWCQDKRYYRLSFLEFSTR